MVLSRTEKRENDSHQKSQSQVNFVNFIIYATYRGIEIAFFSDPRCNKNKRMTFGKIRFVIFTIR